MQAVRTRPTEAAVWMLSAMLVIGVIDNFVGVIAGTIGLWQFYVIRLVLALPLIAVMAWAGMGTMRPQNWGRVAARSLFVAVAMLFYFASLAVMPIGPRSLIAVTTVTPVANRAKALRSARWVSGAGMKCSDMTHPWQFGASLNGRRDRKKTKA